MPLHPRTTCVLTGGKCDDENRKIESLVNKIKFDPDLSDQNVITPFFYLFWDSRLFSVRESREVRWSGLKTEQLWICRHNLKLKLTWRKKQSSSSSAMNLLNSSSGNKRRELGFLILYAAAFYAFIIHRSLQLSRGTQSQTISSVFSFFFPFYVN